MIFRKRVVRLPWATVIVIKRQCSMEGGERSLQDQVLWWLFGAALCEHAVCCWAVVPLPAVCLGKRAASMSLCVAETERLMHSGSSPLAATGLPRATADDSFNCFQSFRLVPAQWRRALVCLCVCAHVVLMSNTYCLRMLYTYVHCVWWMCLSIMKGKWTE